jgi:hypothetical protein
MPENDTITGYIIKRKGPSDDDFLVVGSVSNTDSSFTDDNLEDTTAYAYYVYAFNTAGESMPSDTLYDTTLAIPPQVPFNGPHAIPGRIEAEDYDDNDEGISYHDSEPANQGEAYRPDQGVDIQECTDDGGGYNIGWVSNGEWLEYTIEDITDGIYDIAIRVASNMDGTNRIRVYLGENNLGYVRPDYTGGWQVWTTLYIGDVEITGGNDQILRLNFEGQEFNVNWIEFGENLKPSALAEEKQHDMKIYFSGPDARVYIQCGEIIESANIRLIGLDGKALLAEVKHDFQETSLDVSTLANGIYIAIVQTKQGVYAHKLFIY